MLAATGIGSMEMVGKELASMKLANGFRPLSKECQETGLETIMYKSKLSAIR